MRYGRHKLVAESIGYLGFLSSKFFAAKQQFPLTADLTKRLIDLDEFLSSLLNFLLE